MNKIAAYLLDALVNIILFEVFDNALRFALSGIASSPLQLGFIPQLDLFSAVALALSVLLVFGRFIRKAPSPSTGQEEIPKLLLNWPRIYQAFVDGSIGNEFQLRSQYQKAIQLMRSMVRNEYYRAGGYTPWGDKVARSTSADIWSIVLPILRRRRRYRLSLVEKLSESLGFSL